MPGRDGNRLELIGLQFIPEVQPGDDLAQLAAQAIRRVRLKLQRGDIFVLAQKIVSKAENRIVRLKDITPSPLARNWAKRLRSNPRLVEVVLRESERVVRMSSRVLITETHHGFICANAGVDRSNVPGREWVTCLPVDPDKSARLFLKGIKKQLGVPVAAVISDSFGRPWREGVTNVAIGAAGLRVIEDLRGKKDVQGHNLKATVLAVADELTAAAGLVMGKRKQVPVVIIRGFRYRYGKDSARRLIRPKARDLFR